MPILNKVLEETRDIQLHFRAGQLSKDLNQKITQVCSIGIGNIYHGIQGLHGALHHIRPNIVYAIPVMLVSAGCGALLLYQASIYFSSSHFAEAFLATLLTTTLGYMNYHTFFPFREQAAIRIIETALDEYSKDIYNLIEELKSQIGKLNISNGEEKASDEPKIQALKTRIRELEDELKKERPRNASESGDVSSLLKVE